jgi:hypothetical protein
MKAATGGRKIARRILTMSMTHSLRDKIIDNSITG